MLKPNLKYSRIENLTDLLEHSYRTSYRATEPLVKCQNNGQIAFSDENGAIYVTPYRGEVHLLLHFAGYKNGTIFVPYSNGEMYPLEYQRLINLADAKNWSETYEEAYKIASQKGIQPITLPKDIQVIEVSRSYIDQNARKLYSPLATIFLHNNSKENIGTYIVDDANTIVICDEYSRTFILKSTDNMLNVFNILKSAGYRVNSHPEYYILKPNTKNQN